MELKILEKFQGLTILRYLESFHISIHKINEWFMKGLIILNNNKAFRDDIINKDDIINLNIDQKLDMIPYQKKIKVLYEDDDIIAVEKEAGILIHSDGNTYETLTNMVYSYLLKKQKSPFVSPIHRIDFDTTGIVVFAKNILSLSFLSYEIEEHSFIKEYACLVYNKFKKLEGEINSPIGKDRHSNKQMIIKSGKEAQSTYKVTRNGAISKVIVRITHGRKHQIRVHLSSINHPIVGDKLYGIEDNEQLKLHFRRIVLIHPITREKLEIKSEEKF